MHHLKSQSCALTPAPQIIQTKTAQDLTHGSPVDLDARKGQGPQARHLVGSRCVDGFLPCGQVTNTDPEHMRHRPGFQPSSRCGSRAWSPSREELLERLAARPKALSSSSRNIALMASELDKCPRRPSLYTK